MSLGIELGVHAKRTGSGAVFAAETGFKLASNPDTVRAPGASPEKQVLRALRRSG
jgi:hypothetical protein